MLTILQVPKVCLPKADWVTSFFGTDSKAESFQSRLARKKEWDLRRVLLPDGDEAIRLWYAPVDFVNEVLTLRRSNGSWSAEKRFFSEDKGDGYWSIRYEMPKSGWTAFWKVADELGLRTLPDDSELPQNKRHHVSDGIVIYVELQSQGRYRAYRYDNPECQEEWPEAGRMSRLFDTIEAEFPDRS